MVAQNCDFPNWKSGIRPIPSEYLNALWYTQMLDVRLFNRILRGDVPRVYLLVH